jgi:hypothetical protein
LKAKFKAWYAPIEQPVAMISASSPLSARMCGTTASTTQDSYAACFLALSSSGSPWSDQVPASKESTQYSLTRPAWMNGSSAATMPLSANSQAPPFSVGKTSRGRPKWP